MDMINIAVFVSGNGSNAENIVRYFAHSPLARVRLIVSDNPGAYALERARNLGVESVVIEKSLWRGRGDVPLELMRARGIDYIVLAGFLSLVPAELVREYEGRMINVHPALLPAYGGKGMYGDRVHRAVIEAGERESGITIHEVNERFDEGAVLAQYRVPVADDDTPETLAAKVHALEYEYFPKCIEKCIEKRIGEL